jgi:hypothetical protein
MKCPALPADGFSADPMPIQINFAMRFVLICPALSADEMSCVVCSRDGLRCLLMKSHALAT